MSEEKKEDVVVDDSVVDQEASEIAEIESGIDKIIEQKAKSRKASDSAAVSTGDEGSPDTDTEKEEDDDKNLEVDDSKAGAKVDEGGEAPKVTDAQIERAIRCGISIADAKLADPGFLDRTCDALEAASKASSGKSDEKPEGDGEDADDDFEIPDLDPEEFDEKLVEGWKAMQNIIKKQSALIKQQAQGAIKSWFDSQVESLGVDVGDKMGALKTKYEVLSAGYKAAGEKVSESDVFSEASKLVLGDEIKAAKEKSDREDLGKRNKLLINRPTHVDAQKAKGDPREEIIEEIGREFYGKK